MVMTTRWVLSYLRGPLTREQIRTLMEPVKAVITIRRAGRPTVYALDHDGFRTDRTLVARDGTFEIDGVRDRTPYYLIVY